MKHRKWSSFTLLSISLLSLSGQLTAGEYREVENPPASPADIIKDRFVITYQADDFTDQVEDAQIVYIPKDYRIQAAFFLRCRPYYTNFSVQFLEASDNLKSNDGSLTNEAASFAKHGYVYNAYHDINLQSGDQSESFDLLVGGQNKHLTKLFKTDIPQSPGLLGMSFHWTFNFTEMPSFRSASNTDEAKSAFTLFRSAIKTQQPLNIQVEGRNGPDRTFQLNTRRLQQSAPPEVLDFCLTGRTLLE